MVCDVSHPFVKPGNPYGAHGLASPPCGRFACVEDEEALKTVCSAAVEVGVQLPAGIRRTARHQTV